MRFLILLSILSFSHGVTAADKMTGENLQAKTKRAPKPKPKPVPSPATETEVTSEAAPEAPAATQKVATREPQSYETPTSLTIHPNRPSDRFWYLRVTGAGGYGSTGSNTLRESQARSDGGYGKNPNGLLSIEGQYGRYVGGEIEGNYGLALSKTYTATDSLTGNPDTRSRSLSQKGIMVDAQFRVPLTNFKRDWGFHGGLGYGSQGISADAPVYAPASVSNSNLTSSGIYGTLGVEVRAIAEISVMADYAMSFGASTNLGMTSTTGTTTSKFNSGSFDRLRVQVAYLIQTNYRLGAMFVRRKVIGEGNSGSVTQLSETSNQVLASFQWIL